MADPVDETMIIAWLDGEASDAEATRIAAAVTADPGLSAIAERHRKLKARIAAAFGPIADEPVRLSERPRAPVISLAAARAERQAESRPKPSPRRWALPGAIAASLMVGVLMGHGMSGSVGVADQPGALALSSPIAKALDSQLSGEAGPIRVALSFRDHSGEYCRSFTASHVAGVACRTDGQWQLHAAFPAAPAGGDYRMAGSDDAQAQLIQAIMSGDPLDHESELKARASGWKKSAS